MSRKRQRSPEARRLLQAREADRALRTERANRLAEKVERVQKYRSQVGWVFSKTAPVSVLVLAATNAFLLLCVLSAGFLALYFLLGLYLRRLERERDFYGWVPDTRVIPPDWKPM